MTTKMRTAILRGIGLAFAAATLMTFSTPAAGQAADPVTIVDTTTARTAESLMAPLSACPGQLTVGASRAAQAAAMFCLHQHARAALGLESLRVPGLNRSAKAKSRALMRCQVLSHSCGRAAARYGVARGCGRVSENLAYGSRGFGSPRQMMLQWLNSASHRAVLLGPDNRFVGIAVTRGRFQGQSRTNVWAAHFGTSC